MTRPSVETNKIRDKGTDRRLPAEFEARKSPVTQGKPQFALGVGHAGAQCPRPHHHFLVEAGLKSRLQHVFPLPWRERVAERARSVSEAGEGEQTPLTRPLAEPVIGPATRARTRSLACHPLPQGERDLECAGRSSRDLPGGAVLGVFQHDAHFGELVADAVGFFKIFTSAGCSYALTILCSISSGFDSATLGVDYIELAGFFIFVFLLAKTGLL